MKKDTNFHKWGKPELDRLIQIGTGQRDLMSVADKLNAEFHNQRTASACKSKLEFLRVKAKKNEKISGA